MSLADRSPGLVAVAGLAAIAGAIVLAAGLGSVWVSPTDTLAVLIDHLLPVEIDTSSVADPIIWNIRMPRIMTSVGVGAALGMAGVALHGLYRNPVADPLLVGLSAISMPGVLVGALVGWEVAGPVAAVVGGAVVGSLGSGIVRAIASATAGESSRFILAGIGLSLAISAIVAGAAVALNDPRVPDLPYWFVGSLAASTWGTALWTTVMAVIALAAVLPRARPMDMMSLGGPAAAHLGVDVPRLEWVVVGAIGLGVGGAVGAAGAVAFVGLIGGYLARAIVGEHHRRSVVAGLFTGAVFVVLADALGRLVGGRFEIPIGLVTAAIGGPFLLWMILARRTAS